MAELCHNIALTYFKLNDHEQALIEVQQCLNHINELEEADSSDNQHKQLKVAACNLQAAIYFKNGSFSEAMNALAPLE